MQGLGISSFKADVDKGEPSAAGRWSQHARALADGSAARSTGGCSSSRNALARLCPVRSFARCGCGGAIRCVASIFMSQFAVNVREAAMVGRIPLGRKVMASDQE